MIGPSARNITVCVKVSRREAAWLKALAKGTSPGKGLRRLIDRHLSKEQA